MIWTVVGAALVGYQIGATLTHAERLSQLAKRPGEAVLLFGFLIGLGIHFVERSDP